jgi:putative solute:sodium symporter small subunit
MGGLPAYYQLIAFFVLMPTPPDTTDTPGFTPMRLNAVKLGLLLVLAVSTFGVLYFAPQMDARWGAGTAYRYAASGLLVLYVVLVALYAWYMHRHPDKDVQ